MNDHLLVDVAAAVRTERLRQAQARPARAARTATPRMVAGTRAARPALQVLLLAVFVVVFALAGTATAGKLITGKQIKNGSITSVDLRDRTVSGDDVEDASLTETHFAEPVQGPQGPPGQEGPRGPSGPRGPQGASGLSYVVQAHTIAKDSTDTWSATCGPGTKAIGGGLSSGSPTWIWLVASAPEITGDSWVVTADNHTSTAVAAYAWAVCAASS